MDSTFDLIIIGGGIIGLSTALEGVVRFPGLRIGVLEKEPAVARHQSGHNSGVIHSGVYYAPGSLKAKNCVKGAAEMIQFCRDHSIAHDICGKVVVASTEAELTGLRELKLRGEMNGVKGLAMLGPEQLHEIESHSKGIAALHVPSTGITDYGAVSRKLAELARSGGAEITVNCEVHGIKKLPEGVALETTLGDVRAVRVINCAGLHSDRIARLAGDDAGLRIIPFRGEYYRIAPGREKLVRNLIYPVPDPRFPFLGVHFTRRINGFVDAGPNAVLSFKREGYRRQDMNFRDLAEMSCFSGFWRMAGKFWINGVAEMYRSLSKESFTRALQKLVPEIRKADLIPAQAGVRAQAVDRGGKLLDDFVIIPSNHLLHVCNVPSPAATACLVIGKQIIEMAAKTMQLGDMGNITTIHSSH